MTVHYIYRSNENKDQRPIHMGFATLYEDTISYDYKEERPPQGQAVEVGIGEEVYMFHMASLQACKK